MKFRLIRHATLRLEMAGNQLLVDPVFSEIGAMKPVPGAANPVNSPLTPLPISVAEILNGVDAVLVTHLHRDHLDGPAIAALPKDLPFYCQPVDMQRLESVGFTTLEPVAEPLSRGALEIIRTGGQHGTGEIGALMGMVSGFVLRAPGEPTVYVAGDTIWCDEVAESLKRFRPDVVILNSGAAQFLKGGPITMTAEDVATVHRFAPWARLVVVHMDAWHHCLLHRGELKATLRDANILDRVLIPDDGAEFTF